MAHAKACDYIPRLPSWITFLDCLPEAIPSTRILPFIIEKTLIPATLPPETESRAEGRLLSHSGRKTLAFREMLQYLPRRRCKE